MRRSPTTLSGATFNFSAVGGFSGLATDDFLSVSHPQTLGIDRLGCAPVPIITVSTPVGTTKNRDALPAGSYGFPAFSLRFVGLVSETPFTTATFSASTFGMVIDDLTFAR